MKKFSTVDRVSVVQIPTIKNRLYDDSHEGRFLHANAHVQLVGNKARRAALKYWSSRRWREEVRTLGVAVDAISASR